MRVCIVTPRSPEQCETFVRAHIDHLPFEVTVITAKTASRNGRTVRFPTRAIRRARRTFKIVRDRRRELSLDRALRHQKPCVVLAEFGPAGVAAMGPCGQRKIPLVTHFHGADASAKEYTERYKNEYRSLFRQSKRIVAVSRRMEAALSAMGCPRARLAYNPYGIDCSTFAGAAPAAARPVFLCVGRLVPKKAPHLTILAFSEVHAREPRARLRIVGDGPLRETCEDLVKSLNLSDKVAFLGTQPHEVVRTEMQRARCFVQHSIRAANGDMEGTPVAILEAMACGLPVVATRHGGICDAVIEGKTGFLGDEHDILAMSEAMIQVARSPEMADQFGRAGRRRAKESFELGHRIGNLAEILERAADSRT